MFIAVSENEEAFGPFDSEEKGKAYVRRYMQVVEGKRFPMGLDQWVVIEVTHVDQDDEDFEDFLGRQIMRKTFGPGSLESIELIGYDNNASWLQGINRRVRGTFKVYCGMGNEHTVDIDSGVLKHRDWEMYRDSLSPDARSFEDEAVVTAVVNEVIDEEWSDPCGEADSVAAGLEPVSYVISPTDPEGWGQAPQG